MKSRRAFRIAFLFLLVLIGIGCGGTRPVTPAPKPPLPPVAPKKATAKQLPVAFMPPVVCDDLLADAAPLIAVEGSPTEDQMARILNIATAVNACPPDHPPRPDDLRLVLVQARKVLADWYSVAPGERSASLAGNTGPMDGQKKPVMDARRWAEAYLQIEEKLAKLIASLPSVTEGTPVGMRERKPQESCSLSAPPETKDGRRLDELLGWCTEPHVFMRVDSMVGALANILGQAPSDEQTNVLNARLRAFRDALLAEAAYWVGAPTHEGQRVAVIASEPRNTEILLSMRISRLATHFKALALSWGDRPIDSLRTDLGNAFRSYVARLEQHGISIDDLAWPARVDEGVDPQTGRARWTRFISLRRLHAEILFDHVNLQAMFEIRDAEDRWAGLLDRDQEEAAAVTSTQDSIELIQARMQSVEAAAQLLLRGFRHTETRHARLQAISRVVMSVDLEEGDQVPMQTNGAGRPATAPRPRNPRDVALRSYTSRVFAEIALCLLNDALLDLPIGHGCSYPMTPPPPAGWGADCGSRLVAPQFQIGEGAPLPIPERAAAAYDRVIAALEANWTATGRPPGEKPIVDSTSASKATVCELSFFTGSNTMARLAMSLRSYRRLVQLIADRRLPIDPKQSGPVLTAGMRLADQKMQQICDTFDPATCSASGLQKLVQQNAPPKAGQVPHRGTPTLPPGQPPGGQASFLVSARAEYCAIAEMGEGMYVQSQKRGPGNAIPLLEIVEPHMGGLVWREIKALGDGFIRTGRDCDNAAAASAQRGAGRSRLK